MDILYGLILFVVCAALSWPLGRYMAWALRSGPIEPLDRWIRRVFGPRTGAAQDWKSYALSLVVFNALMFAIVYLILVFQDRLPFNPDEKLALDPSLAFNTAISFTTNTNLQHYSGEKSLSYFSQILGLTWLQFVSAATGIAALAAIARKLGPTNQDGNYYADMVRATVLILLPLSTIIGMLLIVTGVPMTLEGAALARGLEGATQRIARGPVAAMVAIKQLGTNGGGYFGPNSTHPFENPSLWSCTIELAAILLLPMASVWVFGRLADCRRHAALVFGVMGVLWVALAAPAVVLESQPNAASSGLAVAPTLENFEGKELRLGSAAAPIWAVSTTATSNGSVGAMHDSLQPLTVLMAFFGMWTNVIFGGVGVGWIGMFVWVVIAVFLAGLMVGRTPEYLGRKIEAREMKLASLVLLLHPLLILGGTSIFAWTDWGRDSIANPGSQGFSEILYEFSSASANNGSGLEGLVDDTVPWNIATALVMFIGRYIPILLPIALAGSLGAKLRVPRTSGTLRTDTVLFGALLAVSVVLLSALSFLPAAVLGPIAEHLSISTRGAVGSP
jgi:K+-transporting ATPase ATPase A chain